MTRPTPSTFTGDQAATTAGPEYDHVVAEIPIADPAAALTFARISTVIGPIALLVTGYREGLLQGTILADPTGNPYPDPMSAWNTIGHDRLAEIAARPGTTTAPAINALPPVAGGAHHIAIGTNYAAHGTETSVSGAFLFPKHVQPSPWLHSVSSRGLLDYEVELGLVPLTDLQPGTEPTTMGLLLANDLTDRDVLLRLMDPADVHGGQGFTTAKSQPGYLPLGALLVVPTDWRAYLRGLHLELFVDGIRRQSGRPAEMLWDADRILTEILTHSTTEFEHQAGRIPLTRRPGIIDAGTVILTGTPSGVIFQATDLRSAVAEQMQQTATTGPPRPAHLRAGIDHYLRAAATDHRYLQPGQQVIARATGLGEIVVTVQA